MAKKKKTTLKKKSNIAWILAVIVLIMGSTTIGYLLGYDKGIKDIALKKEKNEASRLALLQKKETVQARLKELLRKETLLKEVIKKKKLIRVKVDTKVSREYVTNSLAKPPERVKRQSKGITSEKPKLAIIIDDVCVKSQVSAIKSLGLNVTMSFLPPSPARPNSAKLASQEDFYMVHLPMEAQNFSAEEPNTLRISSSQKQVLFRVNEIKQLFPKVRFINNHTGSKYTSSETAMNKLIVALNKNDISFLDSRTTSLTKVPKVMKNFALKYVARDVFLDHDMDKPSILSQIKKAVRIAKSEGVAIAIGHPHANTLLALHESKKLFEDVELVLINKVY